MIVKVQRPITSSEPNAPALIYDRPRSIEIFVDMTPQLLEAFGESPKFYCEAELNGRDLVLSKIVEDQAW